MSLKNRPLGFLDAQMRVDPNSYNYVAFRGDYDESGNLIYIGRAKPGADEGAEVWQISFLEYTDSDKISSITWPQDEFGNANNDFIFSWSDRESYNYS